MCSLKEHTSLCLVELLIWLSVWTVDDKASVWHTSISIHVTLLLVLCVNIIRTANDNNQDRHVRQEETVLDTMRLVFEASVQLVGWLARYCGHSSLDDLTIHAVECMLHTSCVTALRMYMSALPCLAAHACAVFSLHTHSSQSMTWQGNSPTHWHTHLSEILWRKSNLNLTKSDKLWLCSLLLNWYI